MPSPTSIRKIRKNFEAMQKAQETGDDLFDTPELHATEEPRVLRIGGIPKSPLHLLVMLDAPDCPLNRGDSLYVKVNSKNKETERTEIVIEDWNAIRVHDRIVNSVNGLIKEIGGNDGWANVFIKNPARPGKYIALATVFLNSFDDLQYDLETLQDFDTLAGVLLAQGRVTQAEINAIQIPARTKKDGKR